LIWLLKDFDLLSVLLRAATLCFEALSAGAVAFLLLVALPARIERGNLRGVLRFGAFASIALAVTQALSTATSAAILIGGSGFRLREIATTDFFLLGDVLIVGALALFLLLRRAAAALSGDRPLRLHAAALPALLVVAASVGMSHAAARPDHRLLLLSLTALHHLGTAAWIGAMPFLLLALRRPNAPAVSAALTRRFSTAAIWSVALLLIGGLGMSYFYVGSWQGLYGTAYGLMLMAKAYLLVLILALGAANFLAARREAGASQPLLLRLRRFSEAEVGLGFTAILAAASLTSQPPAMDLTQDRLTSHEIVERMRWESPRLSSPPVKALKPPSSIETAVQVAVFGSGSENDENDRAWSEYNHHWAGMVVLAVGLLAFAARWRRLRWAEHWPLLFIALAVFIVLRADPENWPLGPRSFWASFSAPDVLQHRFYALLITCFALFEWAVETGRVKSRAGAYAFPLMCALGGALLLTHQHSLGNVHDEMLAEMSHTPIALFGATAGWSRWIELRLPATRESRVASYIWPLCLVLVGLVLLDYREA
jgi:putative copper resistance protein D